jgi:hypothetical protein
MIFRSRLGGVLRLIDRQTGLKKSVKGIGMKYDAPIDSYFINGEGELQDYFRNKINLAEHFMPACINID